MPGSSTDAELVVESVAQAADTVNDKVDVKAPAESSAAEPKGEKKGDMLAAVTAALTPVKETSPDSADPEPAKPEPKAGAAKDGDPAADPDDLSEEELSRLKPKTRKRIDGLLADRSRLTLELDAAKPKAAELDKMVGWFRSSNLETSEVNQLFDIGKMLKNDPQAAYTAIKPIFEQLQQIVGDILPADLRQQVAQGVMTPEVAQELTRARSAATIAQQSLDRRTKADTDRTANENHERHIASVQTAVSGWENSKEKADPDWKLKQPQVMRAIKLAIHEQGYPKTTDDAVKIAEQALKDVNTEFRRLAPRRQAMAAPADAGSSAVSPKPKTFQEYVEAGLAKGKAAA